jgi:hypothetical protein
VRLVVAGSQAGELQVVPAGDLPDAFACCFPVAVVLKAEWLSKALSLESITFSWLEYLG